MAQSTFGSHFPDVASDGKVAMLMGDDVADAGSAVNLSVCEPAPLIPRSVNVATPLALVVAVSLPCSVPVPDPIVAVTRAFATALPPASVTVTTGCCAGSNTSLSSALVGCTVIAMFAGGPPLSTMLSDVTPVSPLEVNWMLYVPAGPDRLRLVKLAFPDASTATLSAPPRVATPVVSAAVTVVPLGAATLLPLASCT